MMHIPSFFVGSIASGTVFLLVHQQLSHRERLDRKWPLAEQMKDQLRMRFNNLRSQNTNNNEQITGVNDPLFGKYYNKMIDDAQNFFKKED
mmetsp:Transcript_15903/g.17796  ORF Transcript_15903/g.17796 Transcript_15903/m.17796 type:complete len:91 (-) Transcript_15903:987-1259(-)|eukprot:CAMPEP_0170837046 /NCGR_PEP_ID=MMETSP0734-20130129/2527_1 /TAXON_ID=186038 /ORGANISM="Fragilariopsis kerguelensis, Strain L26-C5" /LENGTH=90 /DNA_ID=CAMNT_0011204145 /DNA_START=18 /DNA_END=290 /DNA_ORIENTATION=+